LGLISCAHGTIGKNPVGVKAFHYVDSTRTNWIDEGPRPLETTVWYPAAFGSKEERHEISIFRTGTYSKNAEIRQDGKRRPLILLSHGTGGSAFSLSWFAEALARKGYIVAAVNHHGNTGAEPKYLLPGFVLWWERPRDMSKVLDAILQEPFFSNTIDPNKIGIAGFSLGGYTALSCVGAKLVFEKWETYSAENPTEPISRLPPEANFSIDDARAFLATDERATASLLHADDSYLDPRIKAAFVMAPVLSPLLDAESLQKITAPVMITVGSEDDQSLAQKYDVPLAADIPNSNLVILPSASHYTFLAEGNLYGKLFARKYTIDTNRISRRQAHESVGNGAAAFFDKNL